VSNERSKLRPDVDKSPFGYTAAVSFKWQSEKILDNGFVPFPKRLMRCASRIFKGPLRMSELVAVLAIVDFRRPQLNRKPSLDHLARLAGLTDDRFRACLRSLKDRKLVVWSGTEEAMDFDLSGLILSVNKLTDRIDEE